MHQCTHICTNHHYMCSQAHDPHNARMHYANDYTCMRSIVIICGYVHMDVRIYIYTYIYTRTFIDVYVYMYRYINVYISPTTGVSFSCILWTCMVGKQWTHVFTLNIAWDWNPFEQYSSEIAWLIMICVLLPGFEQTLHLRTDLRHLPIKNASIHNPLVGDIQLATHPNNSSWFSWLFISHYWSVIDTTWRIIVVHFKSVSFTFRKLWSSGHEE